MKEWERTQSVLCARDVLSGVSCSERLAFDVRSPWLALVLTFLAHATPARVAVRLLVVVRHDHLERAHILEKSAHDIREEHPAHI